MSSEIDSERFKKIIENKNTEINELKEENLELIERSNIQTITIERLGEEKQKYIDYIVQLEAKLKEPIDVVSESAHLWKSIAINSSQLGLLDVHGVANIVCDAFENRFNNNDK